MQLTLPKVPLESKLFKLNYDLYCRVKEFDARMDSLADDIAKLEFDRILKHYTDELSKTITEHEAHSSPASESF